MGYFFYRNKVAAAAAVTITLCILMVIFPEIIIASVRKSISLWISNILPSMLPFFICINFLTGTGAVNRLPAGVFPFVMSVLSGYPMGAKIIGNLKRSGVICKEQAMRLLSYCSTSGPVFIVGTVGICFLESKSAGFLIAAAHYSGAVVNGMLYSCIIDAKPYSQQEQGFREDCCLVDEISGAVFSACKSLAVILVYIILFTFVLDLIINNADISQTAERCLKGLLEMTVGCNSLAGDDMTLYYKSVWASVIVSWSGLSVIGQSVSMLSGTDISVSYVILTKFTHGIFAGIITLFLGMLVL